MRSVLGNVAQCIQQMGIIMSGNGPSVPCLATIVYDKHTVNLQPKLM